MFIDIQWEQGNSFPRIGRIRTDATLSQVTTAGWLNGAVSQGIVIQPSDKFEIYYGINGTPANAFFDVAISAGIITLSVAESDVILPVVSGNFANWSGTSGALADLGYLPSDAAKTRVVMAGSAVSINYIAHFVDVTGTIDDTAAAVTNRGDIYAGLDAVAGVLRSYPATTATGYLGLTAVSNSGAFNTIISNAAMGQSSTISIPNPGAATANFIISALSGGGVQHITTGSLQVDAGGLLAGLATGGTAGSLTLYPATTTTGSLVLSPVSNVGNFAATISNVVGLAQSSVYTLPDPANAIARILVGATATPFVSGNLPQASGTGGLMIDSGIAGSGLQILSASITLTQADVQNMYGAPIQIIAAVANKVIVPVQVTVYTNFQTAAFANGGVAILQYDNTVHGAGTNSLAATIPAAEITAGASQIYSEAGVVAGALTGITNKGLFMSNQTGAFTAGNAASTVVITVSYYLVTASV